MKKTIVLILLLVGAAVLNAQPIQKSEVKSSKEPWKFGLQAGGSLDNISIKSGGVSKFGYKAGLAAEKRLVYNLYFQPTLCFASKSFGYEIANGYSLDVNALVVELDAGLLLKFGDDRLQRGFFLSVTPYYTYGLGGKSKTKDLNTHSESYLEEKEYSTFETANRYDLGFRIGCGYDFNKHIEFAVNYTLGMNRFSNTANYRWRGWNLHLVVFF